MKIKDIAKTRCILTFGYGNRKDYDAFLEYLQKFDVDCVVGGAIAIIRQYGSAKTQIIIN